MQNNLKIPDMLGHIIVKHREFRGVTAEALAAHLGKSVRHVSNIENGHSKPGYAVLVEIIRFLDIPADEIFFPERAHTDAKRQQLIHAIETCSSERVDTISAIWNGLPQDKK